MTDRPVHILLVEDNEADVYLFRKTFDGAWRTYDLTVIQDGGAAMAFVRGEGQYAGRPVPALAVIDMSLPKNDGIQVLEAIRQVERFNHMPVVMVSSSSSPPARLAQAQFRIARYITKPPELESFLQIGRVLKELLLDSQAGRAG